MAEGTDELSEIYILEIEHELRVGLGERSTGVKLELLTGIADIFGSEMVVNKVYSFPETVVALSVYSWQGCTIKVTGTSLNVSVVPDNLIMLHVVLHSCLEERRINAAENNTRGPVTLIVGPTDVGKSALCKLLLNYAARMGRRPLLIDLDVGQNSISMPGTVSFLTVDKPSDIVSGYSGPSKVFQFGQKSPGHSLILYFLLIKKLGKIVKAVLANGNINTQSSGAIINTCGWVRGQGYRAITLAAMMFEIDVLCVLEDERLHTQLLKDMPACVEVLYIPKVGGAVERPRSTRAEARDAKVREYFYGPMNELNPFSFEVNYSEIKVFKVISRPPRHENEPLNNVTLDDINLSPVPLSIHLVNRVLGVSSADNVRDEIMLTFVIGFICVTHVDTSRDVIKVLSPGGGSLPKKILLMGDIKLTDRLYS